MDYATTNSAIGDAKIEVTPEMIDAAARLLWDSGRLERDQGVMKFWVKDLTKEMLFIALKGREAACRSR